MLIHGKYKYIYVENDARTPIVVLIPVDGFSVTGADPSPPAHIGVVGLPPKFQTPCLQVYTSEPSTPSLPSRQVMLKLNCDCLLMTPPSMSGQYVTGMNRNIRSTLQKQAL